MFAAEEKLLFEGDTALEHYQVVDMVYEGRPARILFSGHHSAAQSGLPRDDNPEPLFDYNKRFLELITGLKSKRILLIGGGVYTLPMAILCAADDIHIDVVERDAGLKDIAEGFFDLRESPRLNILHTDGREYLQKIHKPYDVILIDAFTHDVIPKSLSTAEAIKLMHKNVAADGVVAINIISTYRGHRSEVLRRQYATYKTVFHHVAVFPADTVFSDWQSQNFILTAQKTASDLSTYLRFPSLPPLPNLRVADVLLDL